MPRGSPQWRALVNLMAHRCKALNIPPGRTFAHKEVSIYRSDPGQLNIPLLVTDVIAAMEDEMTDDEIAQAIGRIARAGQLGLDKGIVGTEKLGELVASLKSDIAALKAAGGTATHKHSLAATITGETEEA